MVYRSVFYVPEKRREKITWDKSINSLERQMARWHFSEIDFVNRGHCGELGSYCNIHQKLSVCVLRGYQFHKASDQRFSLQQFKEGLDLVPEDYSRPIEYCSGQWTTRPSYRKLILTYELLPKKMCPSLYALFWKLYECYLYFHVSWMKNIPIFS